MRHRLGSETPGLTYKLCYACQSLETKPALHTYLPTNMAYLITGGASNIGSTIARLLKESNEKVMIGTRSGRLPAGFEASESVKLDWSDPTTFDGALAQPIKGVYILIPISTVDVSDNVIAFVNKAVEKGVGRFVLMSGSAVKKESGFGLAKVHLYLEEKGLDHFVVQPVAFMDNFLTYHGKAIREDGEIKSVLPTARIALISTLDIAKLATKGLTSEKNEVTEKLIIGPERLSYDQVAEILSSTLGREIKHTVVSPEELAQYYANLTGWPVQMAGFIVAAESEFEKEEELWIRSGNEIGKETFKEWAERNKEKFLA